MALDATAYDEGLNQATKDARGWAKNFGTQISGLLSAAFIAGVAVIAAALATIGVAAFDIANQVQGATVSIQASLGTTAEEAERLAGIATNAWANNFGDSLEEVADTVGLVRQQLGDLADDELQRATENAFRLSDAFGIETAESLDAVNTLMEQFGLTSDQAFDFVTTGIQRGLNRSDDFIDTITEYSTQFSSAGATADQFFSLLESGLAGGILGTDKAADAFKEFRVRIQDGSDATTDALEAIGISSDDLFAQMSDGTITAADAFDLVVGALNEVEDQNVLLQAGVGLLGTQFEDLGTEAALGLSLIGTEMEDLTGATAALDVQYNTLGEVVQGFGRRAQAALLPIGEVLLDMANRLLPAVDAGFAFFETAIVPRIEAASEFITLFVLGLERGLSPLEAFRNVLLDFFPDETIARFDDFIADLQAFQDVAGEGATRLQTALEQLQPVVLAVFAVLQPAFQTFVDNVRGSLGEFDPVIENLKMLWQSLQPLIEFVLIGIAANIAVQIGVMVGVLNAFAQSVDEAITLVANILESITVTLQGVVDFWISIFNILKGVVTGDMELITQSFEDASAAFIRIWVGFFSLIATIFIDGVALLSSIIGGFVNGIIDFFQALFDAVVGNSIIPDMVDGIINEFLRLVTRAGELGGNIVSSFADAIRNGAGGVADAVRDVVNSALDTFQNLLQFGSPSKVLVDFGQNAGASFAIGIVDMIPMVENAFAEMAMPALQGTAALAEPNSSTTDARQFNTTIQTQQSPAQLIRASRHMDKLMQAGITP